MGSTSVGTAYVTIMPSMNGFADKLTNGLDSATRQAGKVGGRGGSGMGAAFYKGFSAKVGAIAGVMSSVTSSAMSGLASSFSGAVSRLDTLNNYPKVMTSLGYSAKAADASIQQISEHLDGLPSSTDALATFTQQIAATGGSLKGATSLGLAFNDMMLAGGKGTQAAQGAMYQFTQILSKGKAQGEDWSSLMETAPGQMSQLAKSMLGAGATAQDLGEYLGVGVAGAIPKERMEQFKQAIIDLDKDGGKGMASFSEQAKAATGGVGTALDNVKVRASKALTTIMETVGQKRIAGAINGFSSSFGTIAEVVGEALKSAMGAIDKSGFAEALKGLQDEVSASFGDGSAGSSAKEFGKTVGSAINALIPLVKAATPGIGAMSRAFVFAANNAEKVAPALAAVVVGVKGLKNAKTAATFVRAVGSGIAGIASKALPAAAGLGGFGKKTEEAGKKSRTSYKSILACAAAVVALGAGVALAGVGMLLVANAAVTISSSGAGAAVAMAAMVGSIALLALGASAIGPALTAGALGMVAFGAAVALVGAGVLLASAGVAMLASSLPALAGYGPQAAASLLQIGASALAASPGLAALAATSLLAGAGILVLAAGALLAGAGMTLLAAMTLLFAASAAVGASMALMLATSLPMLAAQAPLAAAGLAVLAAGSAAAAVPLAALALAMAAALAPTAGMAASLAVAAASMTAVVACCGVLAASLGSASSSADSMAGSLKGSLGTVASTASAAMAAAAAAVLAGMAAIKAACSQQIQIGNFTLGALPHFTITGKFDAKSREVPSIGVSWYAKGGVFDSASVIGIGERGDEAALPLNRRTYARIGDGIAKSGPLGAGVDAEKIERAVERGVAAMGFYISGKKVASATRSERDKSDGRARALARRGVDR